MPCAAVCAWWTLNWKRRPWHTTNSRSRTLRSVVLPPGILATNSPIGRIWFSVLLARNRQVSLRGQTARAASRAHDVLRMVVHAGVAEVEPLHVRRRRREHRLRVLEDVAQLGQLLEVVADQQELVGGREVDVGVGGRRLRDQPSAAATGRTVVAAMRWRASSLSRARSVASVSVSRRQERACEDRAARGVGASAMLSGRTQANAHSICAGRCAHAPREPVPRLVIQARCTYQLNARRRQQSVPESPITPTHAPLTHKAAPLSPPTCRRADALPHDGYARPPAM